MKIILTLLGLVFLITACNKKDESIPMELDNEEKVIVKAASTYTVNLVQNNTSAEALKYNDWNGATRSKIELKLDAYIPENGLLKRPAIVLIHGGSLDIGSRTDPNIMDMAHYFASRGWVVFSLDYRMNSDGGTVPLDWKQKTSNEDILKIYPTNRDVKAAIRWLYANSETYNIDTNYITVGGGSADAFLSISLGVTEAEDPTLSSTNLEQPSKVHPIISFGGGEAYVKILELVSGLERFD